MKKADMITIPLLATDEMLMTAIKDKGRKTKNNWGSTHTAYKTRYYFRADTQNNFLRVFVYLRDNLKRGYRIPKWCIFFSAAEEDHRTYDYERRTWYTGMFHNLPQIWKPAESVNKQCTADEETTRLVQEYLGDTINRTLLATISSKQDDIREKRLLRKSKAQIEKANAAMDKVQKLPKDFEKWASNNAFPEYYIYQGTKPNKTGFCTHCGKTSEAYKPMHNCIRFCPHCRTELTVKAYGKQKVLDDYGNVTILQKYENGYILREFTMHRKLRKEQNYEQNELYPQEVKRSILNERFVQQELYSFEQFSNTSIKMWQSSDMINAYYSWGITSAVHYMRNMRFVLKNNPAGLANLKDLIPSEPGKRIDVTHRLQRLYRYPYIEYIYKAGLKELANEMMTGQEVERLFIKGDLAKMAGMNLKTVLQISGQQLRRLIDIDGGSIVLEYLQHENGEYIKEDTLKWIKTMELRYADTNIDITHMTVTKTVNFYQRELKDKGMSLSDFLRKYEDYLHMVEERGEIVSDEIICRNHRWDDFHDKYLEEKNREANKKRDDAVDTKFKNIQKDYKKNLKKFEYEKDDLEIQVPKKASDITLEGRLQHHCVGASDNYMSKMNNKKTFIVFLRKKKSPNRPYYTIEIDNTGTILQWYGAYDRKPDKNVIEPWLKKWQKVVKKRINKVAVGG